MPRRVQILVIGFGKDHCPEIAYRAAYQVGLEVARQGAVLISGGLGGVMEAASRGAKDGGGFVVGIVPQDDKGAANEFSDVVIATGIGFARDFLTAYSADAIIIVGGGAGTMIEVAAAYQKKIPIIALKGTGGMADRLVDTYIDDRKIERILGESTPQRAVETAVALINANL
ncbi:MAG: TIGR00725 family protein [Candidatus Bathyarchaeia archaeon]